MSDQKEALREIVAALGKYPVAAIFGQGARTIERWLKPGVRMKDEDERRLRDAFQDALLQMDSSPLDLLDADVFLWLLNRSASNPQLHTG